MLKWRKDHRSNMDRTVECFRGFLDCLENPKEKGIIYGIGAWMMEGIKNHRAMKIARKMGLHV